MDIEDAFTQEAIAALDTNIEGPEETTLREVVTRVFVSNEINWSDQHIDVAMLAFVAGRTYQLDLNEPEKTISIEMTPETAREFISFLTEKGAS